VVITLVIMTDGELLLRYVRESSTEAFAGLVERHLPLVYSAARRTAGPDLAEDVAQCAFIELAQQAARMKPGVPLVAWLHLVARRKAINAVREAARRRARELAAAELAAMKTSPSPWNDIEPLLDEALESLATPDRAAILLRYFEGKSLRDVGAALGTSDDAAQKRIGRALEQLRRFFLRRGIAVTAAALAGDLSAHAMIAPPAGLGLIIASAAAAVSPAAAPIGASLFAMSTVQNVLVTAAFVVALGSALFEADGLRRDRAALHAVDTRLERLSAEMRAAQQQRNPTGQQLATEPPENALPAKSASDLAREIQMRAWLDRVDRLKALRDSRPDLVIPELSLLPDAMWLSLARDVQLEDETQIRDVFARVRGSAESTFIGKLQRALRSYVEAHNDRLPDDLHELAPLIDAHSRTDSWIVTRCSRTGGWPT
jgi:RNA polymerase sigma factor (sigma-70 family)